MTRKLSTSGAAVLRWFLAGNSSWNMKDVAVYESRALTHMICGRLARDGYLTESFTEDGSVFTLNEPVAGQAKELSQSR